MRYRYLDDDEIAPVIEFYNPAVDDDAIKLVENDEEKKKLESFVATVNAACQSYMAQLIF